MTEEMKIFNKDIDVKFTKLSKPSFNTLDLPLSGIYNDIDSVEFSNFPLKNKFKNFGVSSPDYIGIENLFQINSSFVKLLTEETIEGLVILTNVSNRDIIISNLEIYFNVEGITIQKKKSNEQLRTTLSINLPGVNNSLLLLPNQSHSIPVRHDLKHSAKYTINVLFRTKSPFYNQVYYELKQKRNIKETHREYIIKNNEIEFKINKIFSFQVYSPFVVKETFKLNQMKEEYLIEMNIKNPTKHLLTIPDLIITSKNTKASIKPVLNLTELQNNENGQLENNTKLFSLQPNEEVNLLFKSDSNDIFLNEKYFILYIKWLDFFDFSPKVFEYEFINGLDIFNDYFIFQIVERPMGNIIQNNNFPIVFQFTKKQQNKNYAIIIHEFKDNEQLNEKDDNLYNNKNKSESTNILIKNDKKEIYIKIKEYKIEINDNSPKCNVNIICRSDELGIVSFPKIHITLFEIENNNENKISEYIYKNLLSFNCVKNVELI